MQIDLIKLAAGTKARAKDVNDNNDILKSAIYQLEEQINSFSGYIEDLKRKPTRAAFEVYYYYSTKAPTGAFPLWTGEWVNHCKSLYPDFWNELVKRKEAGQVRAIENEAYEEELEDKGQCGAFVVDELNGHVRLPKILHFISSIEQSTDFGTVKKDAQQNITGKFTATKNWYSKNALEGVFTDAGSAGGELGYHGGSTDRIISLNASKQIRTGDYVEPRHVKLALYIQVANNVADLSQMDPEVIQKDLTDAVTQMAEIKSDALDQIATAKGSALNEITNAKDGAIGELDTALQEALEQLNASDVMSGIEQALKQINGGY